jgi:hypothetical protein
LFENIQNEAPRVEVCVAVGSNMKNSARGERGCFSKNCCIYKRLDGNEEEYRFGMFDVLWKQFTKKVMKRGPGT